MSEKENGGPAFPVPDQQHTGGLDGFYGMTLRDYFIAHAPVEPQKWFRPELPNPPERPREQRWIGDITEYEHNPEYKAYKKSQVDYKYAMGAYNMEAEKQWFVQWPAAWADEMIKERSK